MTDAPNLRPDAFAGTAEAYARYRPPYPQPLLADLLACIPGRTRLIDLACGPGRVTLDLAPHFETVHAVDLEPEMIEVGRAEAARRNIANVVWSVGRAEDLAVTPASADLITIGEAFHRLDQPLIAAKALTWLKPGGGLATLGADTFLGRREPWQQALAEIAGRWMARAFPEGWAAARPGAEAGPGGQARALRAAGFTDVTDHTFEESRDWSIDALVGYLQSMSVCSQKALGPDFPAFEAELRAALPAGPLHETLSWGYTLARKPPA